MAWEDLSADVAAEFEICREWSEADREKVESYTRAATLISHRESARRSYRRNRKKILERNRAYRERFARPRIVATTCPKGHAYDEENTRRTSEGRRACRACDRERKPKKGPRMTCRRGHVLAEVGVGVLRNGYTRCRGCYPLKPKAPVTHCANGHELTPDNVRQSSGYRRCKTCERRSKNEKIRTP